jgi:predicted transcriptional regulator
MTAAVQAEERAELASARLDQSLAEAARGEVIDEEEVRAELNAL